MSKPILVIAGDGKGKFNNNQIGLALFVAEYLGGTVYRREDWYQEKCKQVKLLIKESKE